jgi:hypothetical protein
MITYAAGNTTTGKSIIELGALSGTPATFLLLDLYREVDNAFGEHAVLEVAINEHLLG